MISLELPLPPSRNVVDGYRPKVGHIAKRKYQRRCWTEAILQQQPFIDPPDKVIVTAHFNVHNLRDEDGLDLKWVLDCLRQKQTGKLGWRQSVYDERGYFVDDDPAHLSIAGVTQSIDRKNKQLKLWIKDNSDLPF